MYVTLRFLENVRNQISENQQGDGVEGGDGGM